MRYGQISQSRHDHDAAYPALMLNKESLYLAGQRLSSGGQVRYLWLLGALLSGTTSYRVAGNEAATNTACCGSLTQNRVAGAAKRAISPSRTSGLLSQHASKLRRRERRQICAHSTACCSIKPCRNRGCRPAFISNLPNADCAMIDDKLTHPPCGCSCHCKWSHATR